MHQITFLNFDLAENEQDRDPVGGTDLHQGLGQADGLGGRGGRGRGRLQDQSPSLARRCCLSIIGAILLGFSWCNSSISVILWNSCAHLYDACCTHFDNCFYL